MDWPNSPLEISRVIGAINLSIFGFVVEALISSQEPPVLPPAGGSYLPTALKQHRAGIKAVTFANTEAFGMSMELVEGRYRIELVGTDNEGVSFQQILFRHDNLALARSMYKACIERYSGRLILLCEAQVLARSDLLKITP